MTKYFLLTETVCKYGLGQVLSIVYRVENGAIKKAQLWLHIQLNIVRAISGDRQAVADILRAAHYKGWTDGSFYPSIEHIANNLSKDEELYQLSYRNLDRWLN